MTTIRLAAQPSAAKTRHETTFNHCAQPPALLIAYPYIGTWRGETSTWRFRDWALDSGAFTANSMGKPIDLAEFTAFARDRLAVDPTLAEVFALDVIGDPAATARNTAYMWSHGVPAIPTFHLGSPWHELRALVRDYPKVALGGAARAPRNERRAWVEQCFARVWPKKLHGLGMVGDDLIFAFPFHSVDASSWSLRPGRFGQWRRFGANIPANSPMDLRAEVDYYLRLERRLQAMWAKEMALLETLP